MSAHPFESDTGDSGEGAFEDLRRSDPPGPAGRGYDEALGTDAASLLGDGRVVSVAVRAGGDLDGLGGSAEAHLLPARDVEKAAR